jgi:hypothetical protein
MLKNIKYGVNFLNIYWFCVKKTRDYNGGTFNESTVLIKAPMMEFLKMVPGVIFLKKQVLYLSPA